MVLKEIYKIYIRFKGVRSMKFSILQDYIRLCRKYGKTPNWEGLRNLKHVLEK